MFENFNSRESQSGLERAFGGLESTGKVKVVGVDDTSGLMLTVFDNARYEILVLRDDDLLLSVLSRVKFRKNSFPDSIAAELPQINRDLNGCTFYVCNGETSSLGLAASIDMSELVPSRFFEKAGRLIGMMKTMDRLLEKRGYLACDA